MTVPNLIEPSIPVVVNTSENDHAQDQVPTAENAVDCLQKNRPGKARLPLSCKITQLTVTPDYGHLTMPPSITQGTVNFTHLVSC
jgi:hypothetical protein